MFGLRSAAADAWGWVQHYAEVVRSMPTAGSVAFGTDLNGLVAGP